MSSANATVSTPIPLRLLKHDSWALEKEGQHCAADFDLYPYDPHHSTASRVAFASACLAAQHTQSQLLVALRPEHALVCLEVPLEGQGGLSDPRLERLLKRLGSYTEQVGPATLHVWIEGRLPRGSAESRIRFHDQGFLPLMGRSAFPYSRVVNAQVWLDSVVKPAVRPEEQTADGASHDRDDAQVGTMLDIFFDQHPELKPPFLGQFEGEQSFAELEVLRGLYGFTGDLEQSLRLLRHSPLYGPHWTEQYLRSMTQTLGAIT